MGDKCEQQHWLVEIYFAYLISTLQFFKKEFAFIWQSKFTINVTWSIARFILPVIDINLCYAEMFLSF